MAIFLFSPKVLNFKIQILEPNPRFGFFQKGGIWMKKYTMADIAREAGVAKSTVSRYFNQGYIKEETREKIRAVVERTGFEPSAAASNLKAKETRMIGVVAPTMTSPSSGRLLNAMDNALRDQGYACLILTTDHHLEREIAAVEYLRSLRVDGIVLIATSLNSQHQKLQKSSRVPFLVMGQRFPQGTSIIYDDYQAGLQAGEYASEMGHKDIVYISVNQSDYAVGHERRRGVMDGLAHHTEVHNVQMKEIAFSYDQARETTREILKEHVPDLFICATDQIALACYKEVREAGLRVPEDVSLIGFGGYDLSELLSPSLTTIRFDCEAAGEVCANTLISMIHEKTVPTLQVLGFTFRKGGSVSDLNHSDNSFRKNKEQKAEAAEKKAEEENIVEAIDSKVVHPNIDEKLDEKKDEIILASLPEGTPVSNLFSKSDGD